MAIIEVEELTKIFNGDIRAVDGISFKVEEGELLGFLGPNGAGKTTTLNMLSTLLKPTSGSAIVNGHDILENPDAVRRSIGFVFQDPTLDTELTGRENLDFHGRIYGLKRKVRVERIKEMLEIVQLEDRADDLVKTYSGGMKRRLEIARGLLHYPKVLFLDEPTLGLDPQTRRAIWEHIQRLNEDEKVTIILTTHYTEEADYLCNRIQIIDFGKLVAVGTPNDLKSRLEGDIVSLVFKDPAHLMKIHPLFKGKDWVSSAIPVAGDGGNAGGMSRMMEIMRRIARGRGGMGGMGGLAGMGAGGGHGGGGIRIPKRYKEMIAKAMSSKGGLSAMMKAGAKQLNLLVDDGGHRIPEIVKIVDGAGVELESVELHKPTLDDVFLATTGRSIRDERGSFTETIRRRRITRSARGMRVRG
ncbi:MAG: ATP-binding cassette domain-containing protein [Promethearchaeota archaeon]